MAKGLGAGGHTVTVHRRGVLQNKPPAHQLQRYLLQSIFISSALISTTVFPGPNFQAPEIMLAHGRANTTQHGRPAQLTAQGWESRTTPLHRDRHNNRGKPTKNKGPANLQQLLHHPQSPSFLPVKQHGDARHWSRECWLPFKTSATLPSACRAGGAKPNRWIMI